MTAQNDEKETPRQDWNQLAKQALDMWQYHLTALSKDEKAKADMANMMRPMTQMATQWADMMKSTVAGVSPETPQEEPVKPEAQKEEETVSKSEDFAAKTSEVPPTEALEPSEPEVAAPIEETVAVEPEKEPEGIKLQDKETNDIQSHEPAELSEPVKCESVAQSIQPEPVAVEPAKPEPVAEQPAQQSAPEPVKSASRDTASSSGASDLADIAARLALLEQELDVMRPKDKSSAGADTKSATGT